MEEVCSEHHERLPQAQSTSRNRGQSESGNRGQSEVEISWSHTT